MTRPADDVRDGAASGLVRDPLFIRGSRAMLTQALMDFLERRENSFHAYRLFDTSAETMRHALLFSESLA